MSIVAQDTFTRANRAANTLVATGWGTASDGETWATPTGSGSFAITSNEGTITSCTVMTFVQLGSNTLVDCEVLARVTMNSTNYTMVGVTMRQTSSNTTYRVRINSAVPSQGFSINKTVAGTSTTLVSATFTPTLGTFYWIRGRVQGSNLYAKIWQDGTSEPSAWTLTTSDTSITGAGGYGFCCQSTVSTDTAQFDSFSVENLRTTWDAAGRFNLQLPGGHTLSASGRFVLAIRRTTNAGMGRFTMGVRRTWDASGRARFIARRQRYASGRFVLFSQPPPPLAAVAGSTFVPVLQNPQTSSGGGVPTFDQRIDDRATGSFTVYDQAMGYPLVENQRISITDTVVGQTLYSGFVDKLDDELIPTTTSIQTMRTVTLKDLRWLAEKKKATTDYMDWTAGDIAAELHRTLLAPEGITAPYALRHDMDAASFNAGTLVNTSGSSGVLTLAKAGTDVAKTETTTADFAAGTLTNVVATNNTLTLTSHIAIRAAAYCNGYQGNNYCYQEIWAGDYVIASGDFLTYSIWIASTSPSTTISIDGRCSDGNTLADFQPSFPHQVRDQNGLWSSPLQDLSGYAKDMWYTRTIDLTLMAGKHLKNLSIGFEGDSQGQYTAYFHDVLIKNGVITKLTVFTTTLNVSGYVIRNLGYSSQKNVTSTSVVTAYDQTGTRISPALSLSGVGLLSQALVSWTMLSLPDGTQLTFSTSIDGGVTWQVQTNHTPMAGMIAGANLSGLSLLTKQDLAIIGPDPTLAPVLDVVTVGVISAAHMTKTDVLYTKTTTADFTGGTLTNVKASNNSVTLNGFWRTWDTKSLAGQTLFGNGANVGMGTVDQRMELAASPSTDAKSRFDFAGTWQIFDMCVDVTIEPNAGVASGLVWATTGWQGNNDTYAYSATINQNQLLFAKGTNSSSGSGNFTLLASFVFPTALTVGDAHQLRVQWNGSTHSTTIYVDGTDYITSSDASFSAAGNVGVRVYNADTVWHDGHFNNFSIVGTYVNTVYKTAAMSLVAVGTYGDSLLFWDILLPALSSMLVETTIDGGASWQTATNGAPIPALTAGDSLAGKSLQVRFTFSEGVGQNTILAGLTVWVIGQYAASGSRISPVLDCTPAGIVGSSSVTWQAVTPPGTGAFIDSSLDGSTFTNIPLSGSPVAGLLGPPAPTLDSFDADTRATYTIIPF
jgi:hypothetical protein